MWALFLGILIGIGIVPKDPYVEAYDSEVKCRMAPEYSEHARICCLYSDDECMAVHFPGTGPEEK